MPIRRQLAPVTDLRIGSRTGLAPGTAHLMEALMASSPRTRSVAAVGIVVQDLDRAIAFYTSVLGMEEAQRIDVPDKHLLEVVLTFPGSRGAAVLLMHYADGVDHSY